MADGECLINDHQDPNDMKVIGQTGYRRRGIDYEDDSDDDMYGELAEGEYPYEEDDEEDLMGRPANALDNFLGGPSAPNPYRNNLYGEEQEDDESSENHGPYGPYANAGANFPYDE